MRPVILTERVALLCGDSRTLDLGEGVVDAVITDPPYLLEFMSKEWDSAGTDITLSEQVFRAWFAGLVTGEGYFRIHKEKGGAYYACHFGIHMRADEGPLLRSLVQRTGAGSITEVDATENKQGVRSAPSLIWVVQSREDCWKIARILDSTRLHGKKQREYDLWRRALEAWTNAKRGNRWHGSENPAIMEPFYNAMKDLRPFDADLAASNFDPFGCPQYLFHYEWARAAYRALKPGGHLLAFGGTRTYHRMACAIEDAGFEIRDSLHWVYGSGFPKSLNISKEIDERLGAERPVIGPNPNHRAVSGVGYEGVYAGGNTGAPSLTGPGSPAAATWSGWGTALKPAHEPIVLARRPLTGTVAANVLEHGTGGLHVDACRIGSEVRFNPPAGNTGLTPASLAPVNVTGYQGAEVTGRWPANFLLSHDEECEAVGTRLERGHRGYPDGPGGNGFHGGTGRDPDGSRTETHAPIPDREVEAYRCAPGCPVAELDQQSGRSSSGRPKAQRGRRPSGFGDVGAERGDPAPNGPEYGDAGGASRFFYVAKPSRRERDFGCEHLAERTGGQLTDRVDGSAGLSSPRAGAGRTGGARNYHPTVKPIELMRWLCRLVVPVGGVVLDPFTGSGTTGIAAVREGLGFVGIEQSAEYAEIARARIERALEESR